MIPFLTKQPLILASASPRRLELLRQIGLNAQVAPANITEIESLAEFSPAQLAAENAQHKALAVLANLEPTNAVILAADTVVVKDGQSLGKPANAAEAAIMLRQLAGSSHFVYTGICLIDVASGKLVCDTSCTEVTFCPLSEEQIAAYIATGEPFDKAGAYGIQGIGGLFGERINGDYGTVMGLSLPLLRRLAARLETLTKARIYVDFNEMVTHNIVLLSKDDTKADSLGNTVTFYEGMPISIYSDDLGDNGEADNLIAEGIAIKYDLSDYPGWQHVKWCCRFVEDSIKHESDLK